MPRPKDDSPESQQIKYRHHKTANGVLNHYIESQNYLAAYVIAFSILEDRLKAMYVVQHRYFYQSEPSESKLNEGFGKLANSLKHHNSISDSLWKDMKNEAIARNQRLHEAMWQLDTFSLQMINDVKELIKRITRERTILNKKIVASTL